MTANYEDTSLSEKVAVDFDRQNDLHLALGTSLFFPVVRVHAEYTIAAESGFAGGMSFGF